MAGVTAVAGGSDAKDTLHVRAFELPRYSEFLSAETRSGMARYAALLERAHRVCDPATKSTGPELRACEARMSVPLLEEALKAYDVTITPMVIDGIHTDVVTPAEGVPSDRAKRVLINVHGGGFRYNSGFGGKLEAMPLAAIGKYKVVTVDYRMEPEHSYPTASDDVIAVYKRLLQEYEPTNIGLYGCSAGARIIGQALAWISYEKLPRPGAVALLCSSPMPYGGDSHIAVAALQGTEPRVRRFDGGYFKNVDPRDPLAFPADSNEVLGRFPPTLLMTSTRDFTLSAMVTMHSRLINLGVPTELHVFEGLGHGEILNWYIPESRQAANRVAAFFGRHLGASTTAE